MRERKNGFGFTLIELLVVIAIVLVLIAIALPNFLNALVRAKVAQAKGDIRTYLTALDAYFLDWGNYPRHHAPSWTTDFHIGRYRPRYSGFHTLTSPTAYLQSLPRDPFGKKEDEFPEDLNTPNSPHVFVTSINYEGVSGSDEGQFHAVGPKCPQRGCGCGDPIGYWGYVYPRHNRGCIHAYLVASIGPMEFWRGLIPPYWPYSPTDDQLIEVRTYSPTNGTRSYGRIVGMTGAWRQGYFRLDDGIIGHL